MNPRIEYNGGETECSYDEPVAISLDYLSCPSSLDRTISLSLREWNQAIDYGSVKNSASWSTVETCWIGKLGNWNRMIRFNWLITRYWPILVITNHHELSHQPMNCMVNSRNCINQIQNRADSYELQKIDSGASFTDPIARKVNLFLFSPIFWGHIFMSICKSLWGCYLHYSLIFHRCSLFMKKNP